MPPWLPPLRVERRPVLWLALAAAGVVVAVDGYGIAGTVAALAVAWVLGRSTRPRVFLALACLLALAAGWRHSGKLKSQRDAAAWVENGPTRLVTGRIVSVPRGTGGGWAAMVSIAPSSGNMAGVPAGRVWWYGRGPSPGRGAEIEAKGRFEPLPVARNPGEFDVAGWLHREGAWGIFQAAGVARVKEGPPWWWRSTERAQAWFRGAVTAGLDPVGEEAAVIRAMVLGDLPADEDVLIDAYRRSGTLHVFSVSGMHVAMIGIILWGVLQLLGVPRRWAILGILLGMTAYAWLTGWKPPAVRSVTMAAVVLSAFLFRRRRDLLNALGLALLMAVMMDGHLLFRAGVQLSFGVVAAIGAAAALMTRWFDWISRREPYLPRVLYGFWRERWLRMREWFAGALGASSAASVGSLPLTIWHFGFASWVSVLASPLIGIPVFLLMAVALLAAALSPLPWAQEQANRLNAGVARVCTGIATGAAAVPGGGMEFARGRPGENFLIVYDPGHGGGAACLHDDGSSVLFDVGHRPAFHYTILPSLRYMALRPESVVLSHPDAGHIGGVVEGLQALPVRQMLLPVERARSTGYRELVKLADERGVTKKRGHRGEWFAISPGAWLEVLHEPDAGNQNALADERVMVTRLHWRGWRVIFTADAGLATERALLEAGTDVRADVIVAGRHRHDASLGDDFLAAASPRVVIAGHADFPAAERVPPVWEDACEKRGIRVFHQGRTGAVTVVVEEVGALVIRGFLDGSELRLTR